VLSKLVTPGCYSGPRHPKLGGKGAGSAGRRALQRLDPTSSAHCRLSGVTVAIVNPDGLYADGGSLRPLLALCRPPPFVMFFLWCALLIFPVFFLSQAMVLPPLYPV
jgi:hypothetical protein